MTSENYDNKQHHEIQSAYFGHEAFTLFTSACYTKNNLPATMNVTIDEDTGLNVLSIVVVSNETKHERDIAFSCSSKLIELFSKSCSQFKECIFLE